MKKSYVYITTNLINGRKYIGFSCNQIKSKRESYLGSGKLLKQAIEKYSKENFEKEIIKEFETEKEGREYERELIKETNAISDTTYYNLVAGGYGGAVKGRVVSDETKEKIRKSLTGRKRSPEIYLNCVEPILKYDLDGNFICEFISISEADRAHNFRVSKAGVNKPKYSHGFLWLYKKDKIMLKIESYESIKNKVKNNLSRYNSKLSKEDVIELINKQEDGHTYAQLSKEYNITPSCIYEIVKKKTYKWVWK